MVDTPDKKVINKNPANFLFRSLNLSQQAHVINFEVRLQLLAGLIDSDDI